MMKQKSNPLLEGVTSSSSSNNTSVQNEKPYYSSDNRTTTNNAATTNNNTNTTPSNVDDTLPTSDDIYYETGDVILQQGHVLDQIIQIADGNENQQNCILMTRTWSDGTTEEIGHLSAGDYVGLLFYSGFGFMVDDSLVTYTCVKDNVHCKLVNCSNCTSAIEYVCKKGEDCQKSIHEILKVEILKVVPGFCLLPRLGVLETIVNNTNVMKIETYENEKNIIDVNEKKSDTCYILLSGTARPVSMEKTIFRDKEPLEIFGEAKFRNESARRTGNMYAIGETKCLEISIEKLKETLDKLSTDYYKKIETALRYRGNMMDFAKINKDKYLNYENIARNNEK